MESELEERKNELTTKTPIFNDLEAFYHKRSEEYDTMKKLIVGEYARKIHFDIETL